MCVSTSVCGPCVRGGRWGINGDGNGGNQSSQTHTHTRRAQGPLIRAQQASTPSAGLHYRGHSSLLHVRDEVLVCLLDKDNKANGKQPHKGNLRSPQSASKGNSEVGHQIVST